MPFDKASEFESRHAHQIPVRASFGRGAKAAAEIGVQSPGAHRDEMWKWRKGRRGRLKPCCQRRAGSSPAFHTNIRGYGLMDSELGRAGDRLESGSGLRVWGSRPPLSAIWTVNSAGPGTALKADRTFGSGDRDLCCLPYMSVIHPGRNPCTPRLRH